MARKFLKVKAGLHPSALIKGYEDNVSLNLDYIISLEHKTYDDGEDYYCVCCVGPKHYYVTVEEAEKISKELGIEL